MKIAHQADQLVGHTPLLQLNRYKKVHQLKGTIVVKLESFNPLASVKDRLAFSLIRELEERGLMHDDTVIIEPSSGNTGIGLAYMCAAKGYKLKIVMPETMSKERMQIIRALGAELILSPGAEGMKGAVRIATELVASTPHAVMPQQFENMANPRIHRETTGPEIWNDTDGTVDYFVAGVGTGGTITGVGEFLKSKNEHIRVIAVEPSGSPVLSGGQPGPHKIQGIGAGFIPKILNRTVIDDIIQVTNEDAYATARDAAKLEGIFIGTSAGAALYAATKVASMPENEGKLIVVLLADSGERYLSTPLFE